LLALFAQLWMGQLGTVHLARLLGDSAAWLDICGSSEPSGATQDDTAPATQHIGHSAASLHCPVCGAAAASFAPTATVPPPLAAPAWTLRRVRWAAAPAHGRWRSGLRPPAQAPPAA
jgi:rubredoxin